MAAAPLPMRTLRPMTRDESARLKDEADRTARREDHPEVFALFLGLVWYPGALSALALLILALVLRGQGVDLANGAWREVPALSWGVVAIPLGLWGWGLCWTAHALWQEWGGARRRNRGLERDLRDGCVWEERAEVAGVKLFREPEHGMFLVFLLLGDGRVLALYDHDSVDALHHYPANNQPTLCIGREAQIVRFPATGRLSCSFSGPVIPWPRSTVLRARPGRWPAEDGYVDTPWDGLETRFG
jgi:hypothetical protein